MFVPIPSAEICDLSSRSSRYIAQTVCRKWRNLDPTTWHSIPETIDLRPDGTGTVSSPFTLYTASGRVPSVATQEFKWKLGRDGPLGMEDIDLQAMYETMPKLMQSTKAWTHTPWTADHRIVPAYIRIELVGEHSLETTDEYHKVDDFRIDPTAPGVHLPVELIEHIMDFASSEDVAANELLRVCKWTREMVLSRRRKQRFAVMTQRSFARWGLAFWIDCGHFDPQGNPYSDSFFPFRAQVFKLPRASGYYEPEAEQDWDSTWDERPIYYSGELPIPEKSTSTLWNMLQGAYDEHPEVRKVMDT